MAPESSWPEIQTATLADRVHRAVRDRILEGKLQPGEFAREQELSEALGVSRTPVREALGRLASEGLLKRIPHRGFQVPEEALARSLEVYPVVSALEILAGRLAFPRMGEEDLRHLARINGRLQEAVDEEEIDAVRATGLNDRFHDHISERSGNRRLAELLGDLRSQIRRLELWYYSHRDLARASVNQHRELIRSLEARDEERALEILERNMKLTADALQKIRATAAEDGGDQP